jgi:thymidylate synthase (FAD)
MIVGVSFSPVQEYVMRIGERIEVLGNGFIELRDVMGSDDSIAEAARASYGKGTKRKSDNEALIDRLVRDRHTSAFEMAEMQFFVKCPLFVRSQWQRHRTWSYSEYSMRYSEPIEDECYIPDPEDWRLQSKSNKQGSQGKLSETAGMDDCERLTRQYGVVEDRAFGAYRNAIDLGVAREQARMSVPVSTFTQFVGKCDLHNLLHFLSLRKKKDAQQEIRVYADLIAKAVEAYFPVTYASWLNHVFNAFKLSYRETTAIMIKDWDGTITFGDEKERERYIEKLKYLGLGGVQ